MLASSRATPRRREPGGYGIRPYNGFSAGRASGLPVWPVVAGRHVGEGHAPPANPAPETCGFPGICGTYKMTVGRDALIPPHPARRNTRGRAMALPYDPRRARGQPGKCEPGDAATPCRGRCSHRPGQPRRAANAPGGYGIRPYNGFSAGRASGLPVWPVVAGRHVGEGHAPPANPAPPRTPTGGINPSPTNHGRPAANRETTTSVL